jgi:cyclopropane-fatty-acyl-phospholipid synthase
MPALFSCNLQVLKPENQATYAEMTLGQYLELKRYSHSFKQYYVLPMCACVWSVPNSQVGLPWDC